MTMILGFAGRKQSGKTTCSEFVLSYFNGILNSAKIYNFADPLKKDICMNILGLTYEQCYGEDIDKNTITNIQWDGKSLTAREVMQFIGTDIFRKMKRDVWTNATINRINQEKSKLAIIADCRFPNEVESIKSAGGLVIKLMRNPYNSDHDSETSLDTHNYDHDNFDLVVHNDVLGIADQNNIILEFLKHKGIVPL